MLTYSTAIHYQQTSKIVAEPAVEPVTLVEVKEQLRLTASTDEDTLITAYITEARQFLELTSAERTLYIRDSIVVAQLLHFVIPRALFRESGGFVAQASKLASITCDTVTSQ